MRSGSPAAATTTSTNAVPPRGTTWPLTSSASTTPASVQGLLKPGDLVFVFDVGLDQTPAGAARTVLAYQKGIAKTGGPALMGDGKYKKMSPAQFKAATVAKAPRQVGEAARQALSADRPRARG